MLVSVMAAGVMLVQCTATLPHPVAGPPPSGTASSAASALPAPSGGTVQPVTAAELGTSWRPGCPVEPAQLRRVDVDHIGFDGQTQRGELIVHEDLVPEASAFNCRGIQEPTDGLNTPTVGLSTSIRFSTRASTPAAHFNHTTRRPTWTAAAPTRDSYTTATQPSASSRTVAGGGVATGRLPSTTSTSSCPNPRDAA